MRVLKNSQKQSETEDVKSIRQKKEWGEKIKTIPINNSNIKNKHTLEKINIVNLIFEVVNKIFKHCRKLGDDHQIYQKTKIKIGS